MSKKNKFGIDAEAPELDLSIDDLAEAEGTPTAVPMQPAEAGRAASHREPAPALSVEHENLSAPRQDSGSSWSGNAKRTSPRELYGAIQRNRGNNTPTFVYVLYAAAFVAAIYFGIRFINSSRVAAGKKTIYEEYFSDIYPDYESKILTEKGYVPDPASTAARPADGAAAPKPPPIINVTLKTEMVGFEVFVNGRPVAVKNNVFQMEGGVAKIVIKRNGYEDFETTLKAGKDDSPVIEPVFKLPVATGFLSYETIPSATLTLIREGQEPIRLQTPLEGVSVPVGKYKAILENRLIGYRHEEQIEIQEWKTTNLRRQLNQPKLAP